MGYAVRAHTSFPARQPSQPRITAPWQLNEELRSFDAFGKRTIVRKTKPGDCAAGLGEVETFINEYWTSKQRAAHSLHEVSYRACFKPQLPRFFIERLTLPGEVVYDPFMGRGTTPLEAALLGRIPFGCDVNPLSAILTVPRLSPPFLEQIRERLAGIPFEECAANSKEFDGYPEELLVFYHPDTLREICSLKGYLLEREARGSLDGVDRWIRMVAVNRLTGHSPGFFSVYTLPPNQAVSVESQRKINARRRQVPPRRDVPELILSKSKSLLSACDEHTRKTLAQAAGRGLFLTQPAASTPQIPSDSVSLVVTSPPFLDVVNYAQDNWLRCWFCGVNPDSVAITFSKRLEDWQEAMSEVFEELERVLKPGGYVAFEVGEVRGGQLNLEEAVLPCGARAHLEPVSVLINDQQFTKTSNCWGIDNARKGTNTNRVVIFRKPA